MWQDYLDPLVFLSSLMFFVLIGITCYFFVRSIREGYLGKDSEEIKYTVFEEENEHHASH